LDAVRAIAAGSSGHLRRGGFLALEIGSSQGAAAQEALARAGLRDVSLHLDMQGHDRDRGRKMVDYLPRGADAAEYPLDEARHNG